MKRTKIGDSLHSTAIVEDPEIPESDGGLVALLSPKNEGIATDSEDVDAFEALQEDLSPGEAQAVLNTMRPLSPEEEKILDEVPGLEDLRKVDDAEEEEWLATQTKRGYRAMDDVLDDAVFGDDMNNEEKLERMGTDTDLGWSLPGLSAIKRVASAPVSLANRGLRRLPGGKFASRFASAPLSAAKWAKRKVTSAAMSFVPGRDAGKAKLVKDAYGKLVTQHANWLGIQDQQAGRQVRPASYYQQLSRPWALAQLKQAGLPTSTKMSGAEILGAEIMGSDVMGSWYNPFSWFANLIDVMFNGRAKQEMSPVGPNQSNPAALDEYGNPADPGAQNPYADPYAADPYAAPAESYPDAGAPAEAYPDSYAYGDLMCGISGEDSLGAVAREILSGVVPARPSSRTTSPAAPSAPAAGKDDQMMTIAVEKLRKGYPITAGELAIISRLSAAGHPVAKKLYAILLQGGLTKLPATSTSGAWAHKLSPSYWFKSAEEKKFIDAEKDRWKENAEIRKQTDKRSAVLEQAERAKAAADAVRVAREQAAATEAQLKAISASINGVLVAKSDSMGAFVGHEKPTPIAKVVTAALAKAGKKDRAAALYAKIVAGKSLDPAELADARQIVQILQKVRVVHGDLHREAPEYLSSMHGTFVGGCMRSNIETARKKNQICGRAAAALARTVDGTRPLTPAAEKSLRAIGSRTTQLRGVVQAHASDKVARGLDAGTALQRSIIQGAASAAMTPAEAKMLEAVQKLAKAGNPRAIEGLKRLRASGAVVGGDFVGLSISETFKYATAPVWLPAKHLYQGAKWVGQRMGIVSKGGSSPEQQRLSMMRAAAQRRKAASARAAAADAQTTAELRAQQAIAASADAEADAADAESLAKEAAMHTREVEADPSQYLDDESGWEAFVGAEDAAVVGKAKSKDAAGIKIRAGAALYTKAKAGDPTAKEAVEKLVARAKSGDQQAARDVRAVQAGMKLVKARQKAKKKQARQLVAKARKAKVIAVQRKIEAAAADKLVRMDRKRELAKLGKVERRASAGDKRAKAYVAKQVDLAKKGDKKAGARVQKLKLVRDVRRAAPTTRERRNIAAAGKLYTRAQKGDRKAVRQIMVIQAAAQKGNPNAQRAVRRLKVAKAVATVVATGAVTGAVLASAKKDDKKTKTKMTRKQAQQLVKKARTKVAAGSGSREELAAGARAAQALGDKETAGALAVAAARAPSATDTLKKTATVVAAKEAGNPEAKKAIADSFEGAKSGDPAEIKKMGNVVAAQTIDDVNKGRPVPPAMRDAVNLQERIAAGDPVAIDTAKKISEAATGDNPPAEAVAAAISLAAAGVTARALAAKPAARREFLEKVNPPLEGAEATLAERQLAEYVAKAKNGSISPEEGVAAVRLAERLNKPRVAAQVAAMAPPAPPSTPLSSMPDMAQAPITGVLSLLKESLRALTFSTRDPLANWREGVAARTRRTPPVPVAGVDDSGWSPFDWVRRNLAVIAPSTALAASAASLATSLAARKQGPAPAQKVPTAAPPTAPAATVQAPAAPANKSTPDEPAASSGEETAPASRLTREELLHYSDLNQKFASHYAESMSTGKPFKNPLTNQDMAWLYKMEGKERNPSLPLRIMEDVGLTWKVSYIEPFLKDIDTSLARLRSKKIPIAGESTASSSGATPKTFRDYVSEALATKQMSRGDFNRAVAAQTGPDANPQTRLAVGKKIVEFLTAKGVKIAT